MITSASDCFTDGALEGLDDATDGALDVVFDGAPEDAFAVTDSDASNKVRVKSKPET